MEYILNPSDIFHLINIPIHEKGEIELLLSEKFQYILCDSRNSDQLESHCPEWKIIATKEEKDNILSYQHIVTDPDYLSISDLEKLTKLGCKVSYQKSSTRTTRIYKDSEEIKKIIASQRLNEQVLKVILPQIRIGMTEVELANLVHITQLEQGAQGYSFPSIIAFQEGGANPHHQNRADRKLQKGDQILIDMGVILDGYCSDMTRMIFTDIPTSKQKDILDTLIQATSQTIENIQMGSSFSDLHSACTDMLGEYASYFTHSLGHGVGIDIHEAPHVGPKSLDIVEDGMVITIEPGIYIAGEIGSRFEEMVIIQGDQIINITQAPREILLAL